MKNIFWFYNFLRNKHGAALVIFCLVMVILSILFVSFMSRSVINSRDVQRSKDILQAYFLAEAGIDQVKRGLYEEFKDNQYDYTTTAFSWFNDLPTNPGKYPGGLPTDATLTDASGATYTVQITNVDTTTAVPKDVTVVSTATVNNITKSITAVLRYSMSPSQVFDYSYFINNYGWFWGGGITSEGDIRSNGNFSFNGQPTVDGDVYASVNPDLGAAGTITGSNKNKTINQYWTQADAAARPTNPTANPQDIDGDGIDETFEYENGYDGTSDEFAAQQVLDMPFLGDLSYYSGLAVTHNGTVKQGGVTLVNNNYTGDIILIGTAANPIEIDGPVVVSGDVCIKGKVKGQGTIYSGRNTHVLGDIEYVDPPVYAKPDTDPTATDIANASKDFLGLAAKGNIVVGDYTRNDWKVNVSGYLKPSFTQAYEVDPTDNGIGYVSYYSGGDPYFNGDYTANDGGSKDDGSDRKYYESSYNDAYFNSISEPANQICNVDAVMYTNHAFAGKVGAFTLNGSIISRDEAIIYSGNITMNYDIRARDKGEEFYLPRALALPHVAYLKRD
ncbi:MAG: type II secretion system protein [Candidatus Omnitrophota bacterium]